MQIGIDSLAIRASDLAGGTRYRATAGAANRIRRPEAVLDHLAEMAGDALVEIEQQGLRWSARRSRCRGSSTSSPAWCVERPISTGSTYRSSTT